MIEEIKKDANTRMHKSVEALRVELTKIRTGRANVSLLDHVMVDYYGSEVPLNQAANISVDDARTLAVSPWEKTMVPAIEKAIMNSDMGLNPVTTGELIRVPLPALTEETRKEMVKQAKADAARLTARRTPGASAASFARSSRAAHRRGPSVYSATSALACALRHVLPSARSTTATERSASLGKLRFRVTWCSSQNLSYASAASTSLS